MRIQKRESEKEIWNEAQGPDRAQRLCFEYLDVKDKRLGSE
jgi:hypothetical protein